MIDSVRFLLKWNFAIRVFKSSGYEQSLKKRWKLAQTQIFIFSPKNNIWKHIFPIFHKGPHQPPALFLFWYYLEYIVSGVRKYHLHDELGHITQSCRIKIIKKYPLKNWNKTIDKYFQWLSPGCALWFFSKSSLSDLEKNDFQPVEPFIAISVTI